MLTIMSIILLLAGILNLVTNVTLMTSGNLMKIRGAGCLRGILTVYLRFALSSGCLKSFASLRFKSSQTFLNLEKPAFSLPLRS